MSAEPLRIEQLDIVRGGRTLLDGIELTVRRGELVVVVGPNGAGKSTLLKAITGWERPSRGRVLLGGAPVSSLAGPLRAARVGWLPQRSSLAEPVPVIEQVMAARFRFRESRTERRSAALAALREVGLHELAQREASSLSGGEAQRIGLAALIAQQAEMWLLDEPANHLDPAVQATVVEQLLAAWRNGRTAVLVTHDPDRVLSRVNGGPARVVGLRQGRLHFDLSADDPALVGALGELYGVPVQRLMLDGRPRFLFAVGP